MFRWNKLGKVFTPQNINGRPWLKQFAQAPSTLIFDDFIRVYFSCRPTADANGQYVSYSAYVDLSRKNLFEIRDVSAEPIMSLGGLGEFDEFGTYPVSVIRYNGILRAYYGGWTRCQSVPFNVAIGIAESQDNGKSFQKLGPGPVLGYTRHEPFVLSGPKIRRFGNLWYLYYIAGRKWKAFEGRIEPVYKIRLATSEDGIEWTRLERDLIESRLEDDEAQASPDVFFANGRYHMFFCYRHSTNYRGQQYGYRIGYAYSYDGLYWSRDDSRAGIDVSAEGWDSEMISYPHVFELDGKIYMAYLGNQFGRFGFGLAELDGSLV
jgi:hypothetical protein